MYKEIKQIKYEKFKQIKYEKFRDLILAVRERICVTSPIL
jgi:hypothetical protein